MKIIIFSLFLPLIVLADVNLSIFMAADNSMYNAYLGNIEEILEGSKNNDIKINIKADTPYGAYTFFVQNGSIDTVGFENDINSACKDVIADFFVNSINRNKAKINIAVLWDHGNGWYDFKGAKSIMFDNNPDGFISIVNGELRYIFRKIKEKTGKKIDLLVFDACDMHTLEVVYELRDYVKYSIGSQIGIPYYGVNYEGFLTSLADNDDIYSIGKIICDNYFEKYSPDYDILQISMFDIDKVQKLCDDIIDNGIFNLKRMNFLDVSIDKSDYIYNISGDSNLNGLKIFFPESLDMFISLYKDYIKLDMDREYDFSRKIFAYYDVPDTFKPLPVDEMELIDMGYSNYRISFNEPYDFSLIKSYEVFLSRDYYYEIETFNDTSKIFNGIYAFNGANYFSAPYSLFTRQIVIGYSIKSFSAVSFKLEKMGNAPLYIVDSHNDTLLVVKNQKSGWNGHVFLTDKDFSIVFNGDNMNYIYLDDLEIYSLNDYLSYSLFNNELNIRKLHSGEYILAVYGIDVYGNLGELDSIFKFNIKKDVLPYVYPNPAKNHINISTDLNGQYSVKIFDVKGGLIDYSDGVIDDGIIRVDFNIKNLHNGLYYFLLENEGKFYKGKFAVKND